MRRLGIGAAALLLTSSLLTIAGPSPAFADGSGCPSQSKDSTSTSIIKKGSAQPVVLVHGWNGNSDNMNDVRSYLNDKFNDSTVTLSILSFDYSANAHHWAANLEISACLADYLRAVSAAHRKVGGDGKVLVVAHSMGGIATLFAANEQHGKEPRVSSLLGGIVTLDTPYTGSPFGSQPVARAAEFLLGHHLQGILLPPPAGTDGSICLALHDHDHALPKGCLAGPYLPASVPVTQIAGDVTLNRTLFGVHLYDIDLGSDGIVGSDSSQGYLETGPADSSVSKPLRAPKGSKVVSRPERCRIGLDQIGTIALGQGLVNGDGLAAFVNTIATFNTSIAGDSRTMNDLLAGKQSVAVTQLILATLYGASCSHIGITKNTRQNKATMDDVAAALRTYIKQLHAAECPTRQQFEAVVNAKEHGNDANLHGDITCASGWATGAIVFGPVIEDVSESVRYVLQYQADKWTVIDAVVDGLPPNDPTLCSTVPAKVRQALATVC